MQIELCQHLRRILNNHNNTMDELQRSLEIKQELILKKLRREKTLTSDDREYVDDIIDSLIKKFPDNEREIRVRLDRFFNEKGINFE